MGNHGLGLLQGQTRVAKFKSACNLLIIGPRGLQHETNLLVIMDLESSNVLRFDLGPLLQGQMRMPNLKVIIACLLLV